MATRARGRVLLGPQEEQSSGQDAATHREAAEVFCRDTHCTAKEDVKTPR